MLWNDNRDKLETPLRIGKCPIIEAVVDIRFEPKAPIEAVFGLIYSVVVEKYDGAVENLPISQLPEQIWKNDPDLVCQAHYRLRKNNQLLHIGPKVISFIVQKDYIGWEEFYQEIKDTLFKIGNIPVVKHFNRVGVRYINLLKDPLSEICRIDIQADEATLLETKGKNLHFLLNTGSCETGVRLIDNAKVNQDDSEFNGTIIDIDTYVTGIWSSVEALHEIIESAHIEEKKTFFALLNPKTIKSLEPEYE